MRKQKTKVSRWSKAEITGRDNFILALRHLQKVQIRKMVKLEFGKSISRPTIDKILKQ